MGHASVAGTPSRPWAFVSISHPDEIRNKRNKHTVSKHAMKEIGKAKRKRRKLGPVELDVEPLLVGGHIVSANSSLRPYIVSPFTADPKADLHLFYYIEARALRARDYSRYCLFQPMFAVH
jgi:hypothetical protein